MFRLRTLGAALLEGPEGAPAEGGSQKRRVALLALVAASRQGVSRDRLVGMLWPESPEERARHALAQLLYTLRRDLGGEVLTGTATLRLDGARLSSDAGEMERAFENGDLERAVDLYRGPFLEGFYLSGCPDFERWVEEERARIARRVEGALERLAREARQAGEHAAEVRWLSRLSVLTPLDARVAVSLIQAMDASGNRTGALRYAREHEAYVRAELGCAPDPAVVEVVRELEAATPPEAPRAAPPPLQPGPPPDAGAKPAVPPLAASRGPLTPPPVARDRQRARRITAAGAVVLTVGTLAVVAMSLVAPPARQPRDAVLIADVENASGDTVFDRTVPVALAAALAQSRTVQVVPPSRIHTAMERMRRPGATEALGEQLARELAQREGVAIVLVPSVLHVGDGYELGARLVDPATGGILDAATVRAAHRADVIRALDRLGRRVRHQLGEPRVYVAAHAVPLPRVTTPSLDALELFAEGSRAFEANRLLDAETEWKQAVAIDSTFAAALSALGGLYYWTNQPAEGDVWFTRALAHLDGLPERDRVLVRARVDAWRGRRDAAIRGLEVYLDEHPDDVEALGMLAYDLVRARRSTEAVDALTHLAALDSTNHVTFINLATAERELGRYPESIAHYRRAFALLPSLEVANNNLNLEFGTAFVLAGEPDSAEAVFAKMLAGDAGTRARGLRSLAFLDMYRGRYADACGRLREALSLLPTSTSAVSVLRNRLLLASALEGRGEARAARAQIDSAWTLARSMDAEPTLLFWMGRALARAGDVERAEALRDVMRGRVHEGSSTDLSASEGLEGEVLVARRDARAALPHLERALRADSTTLTLEGLAHAEAAAGHGARADTLYRDLAARPVFGWEGQEAWHEALYEVGRLDEQGGRPQSAMAAYEQLLALWPQADPGIPLVEDARARLERLKGAPIT